MNIPNQNESEKTISEARNSRVNPVRVNFISLLKMSKLSLKRYYAIYVRLLIVDNISSLAFIALELIS